MCVAVWGQCLKQTPKSFMETPKASKLTCLRHLFFCVRFKDNDDKHSKKSAFTHNNGVCYAFEFSVTNENELDYPWCVY